MNTGFQRFDAAHVLILIAVPLLALFCVWLAGRRPGWSNAIRWTFGTLLAGVEAGYFALLLAEGSFDLDYALPLQLSDATVLLSVFVAFSLSRAGFDVLYYWAFTVMPLTLLTPDIVDPLPDPYTILFFLGHGLVISFALYLVCGGLIQPRPGSLWRSYLALNGFTASVMLFNLAFDTNYMFLIERPSQPSLLDWLGPWPFYILTADVLALALFVLLYLPWRRSRPA